MHHCLSLYITVCLGNNFKKSQNSFERAADVISHLGVEQIQLLRLFNGFSNWCWLVGSRAMRFLNQSKDENQAKTHLSIGSVESWSLSTAHCFFSAWSFRAFWSAIFCLKFLVNWWKRAFHLVLDVGFRVHSQRFLNFETNQTPKTVFKNCNKCRNHKIR